MKFERLAESGRELHNVASQQMCTYYVPLSFEMFLILYITIYKAAHQQTADGIPMLVNVLQFEKPWSVHLDCSL